MNEYPKELLPQPNLKRIESSSVLENGFIREVESDIYTLLEQEDIEPDFFVELIIGDKSSKKEVFELSLFLYGIFNEEHIGIDVNSDYTFIVAHVDALEAAKEYAQKIESQIEGAKVKVINLVSAVGIHTGLGCLALQVFNEMKD